MCEHREMKYEQKIKDNFNFVFLCKQKETLDLQETEMTCFAELFKTTPNVFCSHEIRSSSFFPLFLHGKERGIREQKKEKTWFKDLLEDFCNGNSKKDFGMSGESFHELVALLAPRISKNDTSFRKAIPVQKRVAVGLWRPAMGNSYRWVVKTFAIGKSATVKISKEFCSALRLQSCTYIKFPDSTVATKHAIETFKADNNCRIP